MMIRLERRDGEAPAGLWTIDENSALPLEIDLNDLP